MNRFLTKEFCDILQNIYSHERMMELIFKLKELEKPRQYTAFAASTAWCEDVLKQAGLSDVRRIAHKADGETASFDFIMPQAWDLTGRCTLEIVEPVRKMIADTDVSTLYVSEYCAPTPEGGVTAELVDYATLDPENPDCKGKFVFHRGYLPAQHPMYNSIAAAGAAGLVFAAFETITHEPDVPSWTNGHGHIGWYHLKEDPVIPVYCVSSRTGLELCKLLQSGSVKLHGEMNTRIFDGEIYTVTATIPGRSDEEFALLGHLYEPFYSDDAQGFGVGVEIALMLKKLVDDGILPQPEKTLRLVFSMERYGYAAFFANHDKRVLAAMSIDTVTCLSSEILNVPFLITQSPVSLPFFGDMLAEKVMNLYCQGMPWKFVPGNLSDDCWTGEPSVDIPVNWVHDTCNDGKNDYHHVDAPIFDAMEPEKLKRIVPMLAAFCGVLIFDDKAQFAALAKELEALALHWLDLEKNRNAGKVVMGQLSKTDALWRNKAAELMYMGRMASFNRFYPELVAPKLPEHWTDSYYDTLPDRKLSQAEQRAENLRYGKLRAGMPFSQVHVPSQERYPWTGIPELIWALLTPERSVLEAVRIHDAVLECHTTDAQIDYYLSYFRFLVTYEYLEEVSHEI